MASIRANMEGRDGGKGWGDREDLGLDWADEGGDDAPDFERRLFRVV